MASRLLSHVNKRARIGAKGRTFSLEMSGSTDRMSEMKSTFSFSNSRATSSVNFSCGSNKQADQATERVALRLDHVTNPLRVGLIPIPQHADEQGRGKGEGGKGGGRGRGRQGDTEREERERETYTGTDRQTQIEGNIHAHSLTWRRCSLLQLRRLAWKGAGSTHTNCFSGNNSDSITMWVPGAEQEMCME